MLSILITKERKRGRTEASKRKLLEVMTMFMALIVMMVSQEYTYFQTCQVVHIKYVQPPVCQ